MNEPMTLSPNGVTFILLTGLVACMLALLTFVMLRFSQAARQMRHNRRDAVRGETMLLSAALQEAVTKLKAQERAMAARADASERLSGEIIASLSAGLVVVGLNHDIRILNPAGRRMLDLADDASVEETVRALDAMALTEVIDECLRNRIPVMRRSVTLPAVHHGVSHLGVTVSPLIDDGQLTGAICLFTDLTAVKDLEEQLRLKDSLAAVGELTAGIAHEFRNGLATIHGYSKLFDLNALPDAYRPYVEGIRGETAALSQVVTNFLNFARPAQLTLTSVDLGGICERAADEFRQDVRAHGGTVDVRGEFATIEGDEVLLRQAFSNLLRNAVEACVEAGRPPEIVVQSEVDRAHQSTRIVVNDNGPGISPELRERVFKPFYTSKRAGTGLGLALVQKIIVFHNGRIVATSSPSGGASFQIALPTIL